jgi:hypothetical protein
VNESVKELEREMRTVRAVLDRIFSAVGSGSEEGAVEAKEDDDAGARAAEESKRLAWSAPSFARTLKPLVLLHYRLRRWWSGAYALKPHEYAIYTLRNTQQRQRFNVDQPAFRWQMGAQEV